MVSSISTVLARASLDDHEQILSHANEALKTNKTDLEAQHVKLVALLKLDQYENAVKFLIESGPALRSSAKFESAYALYKVGQFSDAEKVAKSAGSGRNGQHIQAQIAYRLEHFDQAYEIYKSLVGEVDEEDEDVDIRVNTRATEAMLEWSGKGHLVTTKQATREDLAAFDAAYNAACGCIARSELTKASVLLKRAIDTIESSSDMSDEEKESELLPLEVQRLYILCKEGKFEQVQPFAKRIAVEKIADLATRKVAETNILATQKKLDNPYLVQKETSTAELPSISKPFRFQSVVFSKNDAVLDLLCHKFKAIAKSAAALEKKYPSPTLHTEANILSSLDATAQIYGQSEIEAIKSLTILQKTQTTNVGSALTLVNILIRQGKYGSATSALEELFENIKSSSIKDAKAVMYAPGLVALLVSLYQRQGRSTASHSLLSGASEYWLSRNEPASAPLLHLAGKTFLKSSASDDQSQASQIYEKLRKVQPDSPAAIAGFVSSHSSKGKELTADATKLSAISKLVAGVDITALERVGVPQNPVSTKTHTAGKKRSAAADDQGAAKKKRVRASRIPKNTDSSKPVDPDRWLPLRDRASYNPKGKKNKAKATAATQGGMVSNSQEKLELTDGTPVKIEKANPSIASKKAKGKKGKK